MQNLLNPEEQQVCSCDTEKNDSKIKNVNIKQASQVHPKTLKLQQDEDSSAKGSEVVLEILQGLSDMSPQ